ncbi:hypothetical protein Pelo_13938 [Pelomyxa schiedti]|nr:hypothetical protein Pelo_13938 [Pelomyxa schiedti]
MSSVSDNGRRSTPKKKTGMKRPMILRILFSISFIVLVIALVAAIVPSVTIWVMASSGISDLEQQSMEDTISTISFNIKTMMETNLGNYERQLGSAAQFANALITQSMGYTSNATSVPVEVAYNSTRHVMSTMTVYGGAIESFGVFVEEGLYIVAPKSWAGAILLFQYGYGANYSMVIYFYLSDRFEPNWAIPITVANVPFRKHGTLSNEQWAIFTSNLTLMWGTVGVAKNSEVITADLYAPLFLPGSSDFAGFITGSIAAHNLISLLSGEDREGIVCTFVQDLVGTILSSTCENATYMVGTQVVTVSTFNSTVWEVRDSASHLTTVLAGDHSTLSIFPGRNYSVAFLYIESVYGLTAITTVIADSNYFQKTYNKVQGKTEKFIVITMIIALLLAGTVSIFTLGGQLQIINRIKRISDVSVGSSSSSHHFSSSKVHPEELPPKPTVSTRFGEYLEKMNTFSRLTEIKAILQKLEWLEGKVQIVAAFVPVISKIVCKQQLTDLAILDSSLSRRMGCYLFCDIENFTALCESVSPDIAAKLLELFYDTVEKAAKAHKHNLLVKRLGDGIFLTWGFQLEVERKKSSSTPLPAMAYAAALRISESVVELSKKAEALVGSEAPDWHCTLRIGITTGPALHGLLKTDNLINPDVVGAAVNLAARCQAVGKLPNIKELSHQQLKQSSDEDRVVCTITSDMATHQANTHLAEQLATNNTSVPASPSIQLIKASTIASKSIEAYTRYLVEDIPLQGIGKTNLSVTFVTFNKATQRRLQRQKQHQQGPPSPP